MADKHIDTPSEAGPRTVIERELELNRKLRSELHASRELAESLENFGVATDVALREARDELTRLRALHRVALSMGSPMDAGQIWDEAARQLSTLVTSTAIAAYAQLETGALHRAAIAGVPLTSLPVDGSHALDLVRWAVRADNSGSIASDDGLALAVPVMVLERVEGVLVLVRRTGGRFDPMDVELSEAVGSTVAQALAGVARYEAMEEQALSDALTGVPNYRYFRKQIELELARAQRLRYPLALLIADLDHFKSINDQFGHPLGDQVLARAAAAMRDAIRRSDVLARVGGEEFAVILPACDTEQARIVGDKLRLAVSAVRLEDGDDEIPIDLTVSVGGVARVRGIDSIDADRLISLADGALLDAKRTGRNRTVMAQESDFRVSPGAP